MIQDLVLSMDSPVEMLDYFLSKPRKLKYDFYKNVLYHVIWKDDVLAVRVERIREIRLAAYKNKPKPEKCPKVKEEKISHYLRVKMGLVTPNPSETKRGRGRPCKSKIDELGSNAPVLHVAALC